MGADRDWMKPTSEYAEDWRSPKRPPAAPSPSGAAPDPMVLRVDVPHRGRWVVHVLIGCVLGFALAAAVGML